MADTLVSVSVSASVGVALVLTITLAWTLYVPSDSGDRGDLSSLPLEKNTVKHDSNHPLTTYRMKIKGGPPLSYPVNYWPHSRMGTLTVPHGRTHYFLLGPEDGPKLAMVHGISSGWAAMPAFVESLAQKGFRVLVYDLYGRGYSAAPGARYDTDLYVNQLKHLLDDLGWKNCHLLGYSLGGGIATGFATSFPSRINKLALLAPAGLKRKLPLAGMLLAVPIFGKLVTHTIGRRLLKWTSAKNHNIATFHQPHMRHAMAVTELVVFHHPGFMRAYLSTVKYGPIRNMHNVYSQLPKLFPLNPSDESRRILCIWGTHDTVVDYKTEGTDFKKLVPEAQFVSLEGCGHSIVAEEAEKCAGIVGSFLKC